MLPPLAVDTPEELAQLSQFVINIIDFRDPDCTMTHWQNPDVTARAGTAALPDRAATAPTLVLASSNPANAIPLDQYGMEYNPVALNEVLAFSYAYYQGGGAQANRFFVELVNTLTQSSFAALPRRRPAVPTHPTRASSTWAGSSTRREMIPIPAAAGTWSSPKTRPIAAPIPIAGNWSWEASSTR